MKKTASWQCLADGLSWKKFEQQGDTGTHYLEHGKLKRISFILHFVYFTAGITIFFVFSAVILTMDVRKENEFIVKYYSDILDLVLVDFWLRFSHLIVVLLSLIFIPLIEIAPVLVYYHISKMKPPHLHVATTSPAKQTFFTRFPPSQNIE